MLQSNAGESLLTSGYRFFKETWFTMGSSIVFNQDHFYFLLFVGCTFML